MTKPMTRPTVPLDRAVAAVQYSGGGETTHITLRVQDADLLIRAALAAEALLASRGDDQGPLCRVLGELRGEERHRWGPWGYPDGAPYRKPSGWWIDRKCQHCWTFESREATPEEIEEACDG